MINYSFSDLVVSFLYSKSPIALLKFKLELILPSEINPPALRIFVQFPKDILTGISLGVFASSLHCFLVGCVPSLCAKSINK